MSYVRAPMYYSLYIVLGQNIGQNVDRKFRFQATFFLVVIITRKLFGCFKWCKTDSPVTICCSVSCALNCIIQTTSNKQENSRSLSVLDRETLRRVASTATVAGKVWGEYVSVVCQNKCNKQNKIQRSTV